MNAPSKIKKNTSDGASDNHTQEIGQSSSDFMDDDDLSIGAEESNMISHQAIQQQQPEVPMLRPHHDIRRAELCQQALCFHSRIFYIRQSDERVDLGEILNFKAEFEANLDIDALANTSKSLQCQESIFGSKKFYIEIEMCFKEANQSEIDNHDNV